MSTRITPRYEYVASTSNALWDSTCHNEDCPFRSVKNNECKLVECDYVGGTAQQPEEGA